MKRKILRYLVLTLTVLIGIMLAISAVEVGLRVITKEKTGDVRFTTHPTAFVTLSPNAEKIISLPGGKHYSVRTGPAGARSDGTPCKNADILLFGDSNLFAEFLPFNQTLGEQLGALYDNNVCSSNFGVPGYGPDQGLLRMSYELDRLDVKPQVIVFHVFADNDYGDLFRNNLVTIDEQGNLKRTSRTEPDFKLGLLERLQAKYLIARRIRDLVYKSGHHKMSPNEYIPNRSGAYLKSRITSRQDIFKYVKNVEEITHEEFINYKRGKHTTWLGDLYDFAIALAPESEAAVRAEELMTVILKEAKQESDSVGACFVVLIQPSEWDVAITGPITRTELYTYSAEFNRGYNSRNLTNIARRAATRSGAHYINLYDLYSPYGAHAYQPVQVDHGDNHWNTIGIRIAAAALHEFIEEKGCLKSGS